LFIRGYEHNEPATIPLLKFSRLYFLCFASYKTLKYSINIVGTPYKLVALYFYAASRLFYGSNPSPTIVIAAPLVSAAKLPMTIPKQW